MVVRRGGVKIYAGIEIPPLSYPQYELVAVHISIAYVMIVRWTLLSV
jgi:hypothetical protein